MAKFKKLRQYRLKVGKVYWYSLYYDVMPRFLTQYSPPGGSRNYAYYLLYPWKYVEDLYYQAKWFVQRGRRGYSDRDVWSIDFYLNSWMPQALEQLRRTKHGTPMYMTPKQWDRKVDRMVNAFKVAAKIEDCTFVKPDEYRAALKQFRKDFDVFKNHYFSLWD